MTADPKIEARKSDHIRLCLEPASQFQTVSTGLDRLRLVPEALPELAPGDVELGCRFLGRPMRAPILVSSMTGGPREGARINQHLAEGVQRAGLGMGVGSQRIALVRPETQASFRVRALAPDIPLVANLGAVQLNHGFGLEEARAVVEMIGADGLFLHLNALQEVVQPEGDTDFRGLEAKIGALVRDAPFPILIKECGAGIAPSTLARLWALGVAAVDVSGAGGTSWARVEGHRAEGLHRSLGDTFGDWGLPTAAAVELGRAAVPDAVIIASGGIRSGLDAAKAFALGADYVSIAQPVLAAALESGEAVAAVLERFVAELRTACFLCGARTPAELRAPGRLVRV